MSNSQGIKLARADWLLIEDIDFHNYKEAALHACSSCENICQRRQDAVTI